MPRDRPEEPYLGRQDRPAICAPALRRVLRAVPREGAAGRKGGPKGRPPRPEAAPRHAACRSWGPSYVWPIRSPHRCSLQA